MDAEKIKQLKLFIEQCETNPSILSDPSISFFKDYLESLGAKLPASAYAPHEKPKSPKTQLYDESDDDMSDIKEETDAQSTNNITEDYFDSDISESDIEFDDDIVEADNEPPQKMGDPTVEVTDENRDAAQMAKAKAMEGISEGKFEEAIDHLTEAILCNPTSAIMYATRASVFVKMKKPNAAIQDANAALEINPDSAKGYKSRGMARALLGQWEDAAKDLHVASKIDFDEEIASVLKKVEPNARKIEEHNRKYERLRKEREEKRIARERQRHKAEAQAEYESAKRQEHSTAGRSSGGMPAGMPGSMPGGFPGGMPGGSPGSAPGGIPGNIDMGKIFSDPELMAAFKDPQIMAEILDVMKNPANIAKHQNNPKMAPIIAKLMTMFGGAK
ncbi:FAM10 family protein At4g22670 [Amborella trichopoda]|uniref:FAM10 family protein At4g22670 n=1 Tax=Amborella trichopoda TaxID=13333 RepID=UPI0005D3D3A7|nr:FAM10 family protein At4g22670 [Amborella trichopoda]XP_011626895.1 FAM10 family protein At4g22670 [Amborella trichopoda]XP_011626896.1 FAM10 family protein At4g22670 [Amborella trichopoda]XP_011626897.1 FAM10 family protein At4g22670 [Amborella trichopoda]|eukprot:XP_011626894.1 FAM10 family protein At4g22670 [Amborella trichopoda]